MDKQTKGLYLGDFMAETRSLTAAALKARDNYRRRMAVLEAQKETYSAEYLKGQADKARADYQEARASCWPKFEAALGTLEKALNEANEIVNFSPELASAVTVIKTLGSSLTPADVHRINVAFQGDQGALHVLKAAYKGAGAVYDGNIDAQIYNTSDAMLALAQRGYAAFQNEGSLNSLAAEVGRLASFEGREFETLPDVQGATEAAFRAAGLTLNPDGSVEGVSHA